MSEPDQQTLEDISNMKVGDVLALDQPISEPIIAGKKFQCQVDFNGENIILRIR
jgi:flagellar motor switch protein FliM